MDPQACLAILSRAAVQHSQQQDGSGCACGAGGFCSALPTQAEEDTAAVPPPPLPPVGAEERRERRVAGQGQSRADEHGQQRQPDQGRGQGLGQVIDLETGENETVANEELSQATILELFPELRPPSDNEGTEVGRLQEGKAVASSAAPADFIMKVVKLHEMRVAVHKAYDGAFRRLLGDEGPSGSKALARAYPFVVACATSRFQTLSEGVRSAAAALEDAALAASEGTDKAAAEAMAEAASLVRKLQGLESARLHIVAAHHAEQCRLRTVPQEGGEDGEAAQAARTTCAGLRRQLGSTAEDIEEAVSELRYCAADLRS